MADQKQEEAFRVVDRRLFTAEGELRKEVAEQERQDTIEEERKAAKAASTASAPAKQSASAVATAQQESAPTAKSEEGAVVAPVASRGFQVLVDFLAGNAAARLGMLPDPRTGQAFLDLEGANELIDMLDALREKTRDNLTHEEEQLLLEVLRSLKLSYLEMTKAAVQATKEEAAKRKA